jgi:hypothetical protein
LISPILKIIASSLLKPYFSALALNLTGGSIIGSRDKTNVPQCIPITFLLFKSCATFKALNVAQDLKSKKVIGMHWGTFVLSLEPIMEPPVRFKASAEKYGFNKEDAIIFKIGEINSLKDILLIN